MEELVRTNPAILPSGRIVGIITAGRPPVAAAAKPPQCPERADIKRFFTLLDYESHLSKRGRCCSKVL